MEGQVAGNCLFNGLVVLYHCPGGRSETVEPGWKARYLSRMYPCRESSCSGALHMHLEMAQVGIDLVRVPVTLTEAETERIAAVLEVEYQPCSVPTLGETVFGTVYQLSAEHGSELVLTLSSRGSVVDERSQEHEVQIRMSEGDSKVFWRVDGEISAALKTMAAKKSTKTGGSQRQLSTNRSIP